MGGSEGRRRRSSRRGFRAAPEEVMMAAAVAPQKRAGSAASGRADHLYPVDIKGENPEALEEEAHSYYTKILEEPSSAVEFLSIPGRGKVKLEAPLMHFLPLYKEDSKHKLLVLIDPQDKNTGSLCDGYSSQCYMLPVLDTMFVRKKFRRGGVGMKMLHDFCQTFAAEVALGLSCPVSAVMYQVCQSFLETHPEEQSRLWEVEAPGDWSQRVSIWLKIQMEQKLQKKSDVSCYMKRLQNDEPGQSDEGRMNQKVAHSPNKALPCEAEEFKDDPEEVFNPEPYSEEYAEEHQAHKQQWKGSKKRASQGEPSEDRISKQFRATS
ncbi:Hypothetical predicted protein [Podarcis lilfordi]|uniref:Protein FAM169B n=1 Tax=Podarcis lilfordi TaxID=74358 RepID=A0AA35PNU4_9SAUR|nr:Hypothetical predicted protein [Podarcis lilfordi]